MYPLHLHHCTDTTKHRVVVLSGGGTSHPAAALNLSKSHLNFRGDQGLMPVQGDACRHLGTELDFFPQRKRIEFISY